jgi:hypothetical protein
MSETLVVANRTLGGAKLYERVRELAADEQGATFRLVVPQNKPTAGLVIYDEAVRESALVRVDLAMSLLAEDGIQASGEVGDPDPFMASMDAIALLRPARVIVSTHPASQSGWLRRDLVERIANASGLPVEHIVTDLAHEGLPFAVTLVVANKTSSGAELLEHLRAKASGDERHMFIAVVPQLDGGGTAPREARIRLAGMLERMHDEGLLCAGMIGDPDPYTAVMNALELFRVDDIVISTLPNERSGWLRANLVERVAGATAAPVEHVESEPAAAGAARAGVA